jgi:D-alanine-D-alanine ligase
MSRVVIVFGGSSSERLVSVASAQNVSAHLPGAELWFWSAQGSVFEIDSDALAAHQRPFELELVPEHPARWPSLPRALDEAGRGAVFFLALHGGEGENGVTQALFEARDLAFTGSSSEASAAAFDKAVAKALASARGARVADAITLEPAPTEVLAASLRTLLSRGAHWVLKPQADGSSHGLIHLTSPALVDAAVATISALRIPYLAEAFVEGRELTVGVVEDERGVVSALPVSEVRVTSGRAFDYQGKYLGHGTVEITPAELDEADSRAAQELAVLTHRAVGCFGYSRTDMILTAKGPVLLEINTLPGMTRASFIPQQLAAAGRSLESFLASQLSLAERRQAGQSASPMSLAPLPGSARSTKA